MIDFMRATFNGNFPNGLRCSPGSRYLWHVRILVDGLRLALRAHRQR
jgi:hypothetical protein